MNAPNITVEGWAGVDVSSAEAIIARAIDLYHPALTIASSFSHEDVLLIDMAVAHRADVRVFALDTGRLPEETYACAEAVRARYGLEIEWYAPDRDDLEALIRDQGLYSFKESLDARHACCAVRKVGPLKRALAGKKAWVTGQRRSQSVTRATLSPVEASDSGPIKINPLADWSLEQVQAEVKARGLPYNALYDQGYRSIGCAPCTRAVLPGEDERAGRWWWEQAEHKECGLHGRPGFEHLSSDTSRG
ncbi:MAG: phosphoadenylyl-sulfate reductase [Bradymonadia bacterium]